MDSGGLGLQVRAVRTDMGLRRRLRWLQHHTYIVTILTINMTSPGVAPVAPGPAGGPGVAHPALQVRVGEVQLHAVAVAAVLTALALPALALPLQTSSLL